jgi:hypothetical protein
MGRCFLCENNTDPDLDDVCEHVRDICEKCTHKMIEKDASIHCNKCEEEEEDEYEDKSDGCNRMWLTIFVTICLLLCVGTVIFLGHNHDVYRHNYELASNSIAKVTCRLTSVEEQLQKIKNAF